MADYWVYNGASGSGDGSSWTNAYTSVAAAETAGRFLSNNRIFVAHDHSEPGVGAARSYTGPTANPPCYMISSDRDDTGSVPAYRLGTGNQLYSGDGAYTLRLEQAWALYGIRVRSGSTIIFSPRDDECLNLFNCTLLPGHATGCQFLNSNAGFVRMTNCVFDLSGDTGATNAVVFTVSGTGYNYEFIGGSLANASNRTGGIFNYSRGLIATGMDLSSATAIGGVMTGNGPAMMVAVSNCRTRTNVSYFYGTPTSTTNSGSALLVNVGPEDNPSQLWQHGPAGIIQSSNSVYRSGGATVESMNVGWLVTTLASCSEGNPLYAPWMYGTVDSTGSKNFDVFISNDSADFDNSEVWLDVQFLGTSDEPDFSYATDKRTINATPTTSPNSVSRDDTTSTWTGTGTVNATYSQTSSIVTVTSTAHGLSSGQNVGVDFTSGGQTNDGTYVITVTDANTFTFNPGVSGTYSGNLTWTLLASTYKQKLRVTATVSETGQYRARVCVGVTSLLSSRYFYIDPKVTVS